MHFNLSSLREICGFVEGEQSIRSYDVLYTSLNIKSFNFTYYKRVQIKFFASVSLVKNRERRKLFESGKDPIDRLNPGAEFHSNVPKEREKCVCLSLTKS